MKLSSDKFTGLVLAGGRARRMAGRDKGLIELAGRPMVHWVVQRLVPQTASVLISANRNVERYADLGFEVIRDVDDGFLGPLAGISAGLTQAATPWLVTVPCDHLFVDVLFKKSHVVFSLVEYRLEHVFEQVFSKVCVIVQICKCNLGLNHPEFSQVSAGI